MIMRAMAPAIVVKKGAVPLIARDSIEPMSTIKTASNAVFCASERRSPIRTRASPTVKMMKHRSAILRTVSCVALPSGPRRTRKKFWSAFMTTFRRAKAIRAYQTGWFNDKSGARCRFVSLLRAGILPGGNHGTRKQKEIHGEAKTESRAHRGRLRETRHLEEGSGEARLGDREQVR